MSKTVLKIIITIVLVALLGVGVWFVIDTTDGGKTEFETFQVAHNGENIEDGAKMFFEVGESYTFDIAYTFDFDAEASKGYNLKIVPNSDFKQLYFNVDNKNRLFANEGTLTQYFDIEQGADSFTLKFSKDFCVEEVIKGLYPDKAVTVYESNVTSPAYYYRMVISSPDGKSSCTVNFGVKIHATSVEFVEKEMVLA